MPKVRFVMFDAGSNLPTNVWPGRSVPSIPSVGDYVSTPSGMWKVRWVQYGYDEDEFQGLAFVDVCLEKANGP